MASSSSIAGSSPSASSVANNHPPRYPDESDDGEDAAVTESRDNRKTPLPRTRHREDIGLSLSSSIDHGSGRVDARLQQLENSTAISTVAADAAAENCNGDSQHHNNSCRVAIFNNNEQQQLQMQTTQPSTVTRASSPSRREAQLESRMRQLEQSLMELSQFCQTILRNQQQTTMQTPRQQKKMATQDGSNQNSSPQTPNSNNHHHQIYQSDEDSSSPEEHLNNNLWPPSTMAQYAPFLDSPDVSMRIHRHHSPPNDYNSVVDNEMVNAIKIQDGGEGGDDDDEVDARNNMHRNSLSVKLGVSPYINNEWVNDNKTTTKKGGKAELSKQKKTMSMLFLDIEPGQFRGPNLITLDPVAVDNDDDHDVRRDGENYCHGGGSSEDSRRNSNDSRGGGCSNSIGDDDGRSSSSSSSVGVGGGGGKEEEDRRERGGVADSNSSDVENNNNIVNKNKEAKRDRDDGGTSHNAKHSLENNDALMLSPQSSPTLHHDNNWQPSSNTSAVVFHSSPTFTTVTENSLENTNEDEGYDFWTKSTSSSSPLLPASSSLDVSKSRKSDSSRVKKREESLEYQAYTPSHLEALQLRREAGKGRAYSCNDAVISPPRAAAAAAAAFPPQRPTMLPTISSPVWKPSFEALNGGDESGGEIFVASSSSIMEITTLNSNIKDVLCSNNNKREKDISAIPELIVPDLNNRDTEGVEDRGIDVATIFATSAGDGVGSNKLLPPSTSCASNLSSDTTKTTKIGNIQRDVRANSITSSSKERSQSVSSSKSKDSGSGVVTVVTTVNIHSTSTAISEPPSCKKDKKLESKSSSHQQPQQQLDSGKNKTMSEYVINDLLNIDSRNHDGSATEDVDANMEEFLRIPAKLEYLMLFSLAVCVDCFLYVWAMLPLKFIWGVLCLTCTIYKMIKMKKWRLRPDEEFHGIGFHRRHLYALLQSLLIWLVYSQILCPISIGKLYHWIRGQAMLKLYVLIAIVEVFDRLLCSFGQDAWDSLYWNTTRRPRHPRLFVSFIVVGVYVTIHSLFLFVHVATLSVAVNSADNALLTLLISGNFAEIKSTVFKKYNKQNLFKITTSDICERFKLALFLLLILFLNGFQGEMTSSMVNDYYLMCGIVFASELISDWIKHSFITKFNFIKSTAYFDYALVLSGDVTGIGHEGSLDYTHAAVKRLGLAQIPLVCVTARYLHEAVRYAIAFKGNGDMAHPFSALVDLMADGSKWKFFIGLLKCMGGLVVFKVFLGICIRAVARRHLGGDSRVALKEKSPSALKVKDQEATAVDTKKKQ